jgi:hypothetical protein
MIKNKNSSQWITSNNSIYYNTSNVGIGTFNPINKLHIYDDITTETKLTIQNNTNIATGTLANEITVADATTTTIGADRIIQFP